MCPAGTYLVFDNQEMVNAECRACPAPAAQQDPAVATSLEDCRYTFCCTSAFAVLRLHAFLPPAPVMKVSGWVLA